MVKHHRFPCFPFVLAIFFAHVTIGIALTQRCGIVLPAPLSRNPASGRWLSPLWLVNGRYVTMYHNVAFQPASNIWVTATALHRRCSTVLWPSCVLTLRHAATPIGAWVQQIHKYTHIIIYLLWPNNLVYLWLNPSLDVSKPDAGRRPAQAQPKAQATPRGYGGHINGKQGQLRTTYRQTKKHLYRSSCLWWSTIAFLVFLSCSPFFLHTSPLGLRSHRGAV